MESVFNSLSTLLSSPLGGLIVVLIIVLIFLRRHKRAQLQKSVDDMHMQASQKSIEYESPLVNSLPSTIGSTPTGVHHFRGHSHNIAWEVETVYLEEIDAAASSTVHRGMSRKYTRWTTDAFRLPATQYLLCMSLPDSVEAPAFKQSPSSGFLSSLVDSVAGFFLSMYLRMYFGSEQAAGAALRSADYIETIRGFADKDFRIFSNAPSFYHQQKSALTYDPAKGAAPKNFSVLVHQGGVCFSCPDFIDYLEEVQNIAEYCATITHGMMGTVTS